MIYYSNTNLVIRNMDYVDVPSIVTAESVKNVQVDSEKFLCRLQDQEKCKNIALIALYQGNVAGYVNVYPYSIHGALGKKGYSEIVDFTVFEQYENLDIEENLMNIAENIASDYSTVVYLSVKLHDYKTFNQIINREYLLDKSGVWYKNKVCSDYSICQKGDDLELWFYKQLQLTNIYKFPVSPTSEFPCLRLFELGIKKADGRFNNEKYQKIKVGDKVFLVDNKSNDFIRCEVIFRHEYKTTKEMLQSEGVKNMLPFLEDDDIEKGVQYYQNFAGWYLVEKYGCVAFGLKVF